MIKPQRGQIMVKTLSCSEHEAMNNILLERGWVLAALAFSCLEGTYKTWKGINGDKYESHFYLVINLSGISTMFMVEAEMWDTLDDIETKYCIDDIPIEYDTTSIDALKRHIEGA